MRLHRHRWEHHPAFSMIAVRRCVRCGRVEDRFVRREWEESPTHLQPPRDRLRKLRPFGLFWEASP